MKRTTALDLDNRPKFARVGGATTPRNGPAFAPVTFAQAPQRQQQQQQQQQSFSTSTSSSTPPPPQQSSYSSSSSPPFTTSEPSSSESSPRDGSPGRAIQMIGVREVTGSDGKLKDEYFVTQEAYDILSKIPAPFGVATTVGRYRTGKSLLINMTLLRIRRGKGFNVGSTTNACTKGLILYTNPIECYDSVTSQKHQCLVVDTEGIGSLDASVQHHTKIFALAFLLSSYFIFNSMGAIDEPSLENLTLVIEISKCLKKSSSRQDYDDADVDMDTSSSSSSSSNDNNSSNTDVSPTFMWVLRDFVLDVISEDGRPQNNKEYLEASLAPQKNSDPAKNNVRSMIKTVFPKRSCVTLVRPVAEESDLRNMDNLPDEKIRPEFKTQVARLSNDILNNMPIKSVFGRPISGATYVKLMQSYVEAINQGATPVIRETWELLSESQCRSAKDDAMSFWRKKVSEVEMWSQATDEMNTGLEVLRKKTTEVYKRLAIGSCLDAVLSKLMEEITFLEQDISDRNHRHVMGMIDKELDGINNQIESFNTVDDLLMNIEKVKAHISSSFGNSKHILATVENAVGDRLLKWVHVFVDRLNASHQKTQQDMDELMRKYRDLQGQIEKNALDYAKELKDKAEEMERFQRRMTSMSEESERVRQELQTSVDLKLGLKDQEIESLNQQIASSREHIDTIQAEAMATIHSQTSASSENQSKLEALELQYADLEDQKKQVEEELGRLHVQMETLRMDSNELDNERLVRARVEASYERLQKELNGCKDDLLKMQNTFAEKIQNMQQQSRSVLDQRKRIQEQEQDTIQSQMVNVKGELADLEQRHFELEENYKAADQELQDARRDREKIMGRHDREMDELRREKTSLTESLTKQGDEFKQLMKAQQDKWTAENQTLKENEAKLKANQMKDSIESTGKLKELEQELRHTKVRLDDALKRGETEESKKKREQMTSDLDKYRNEANKLENRIRYLERDVAHYEQKIGYQKDEHDKAIKKLREMETEHREALWETEVTFNREIIQLKEQLQVIRKDLADKEDILKRTTQQLNEAKRSK